MQNLLVEDLGDEPHVLVHPHLAAIADRDAGGLLASMLKREEGKERHARRFLARCIESDDSTFLLRSVPDLGQVDHYWSMACVRTSPPCPLSTGVERGSSTYAVQT